MPQAILPLFCEDMIEINTHFAVAKRENVIYWFQGSFPVFRHHVHDQAAFRSFCCQLINLGNATSSELSRALNVNHEKLSRWARMEGSPKNFVQPSKKNKKKQCFNP